MQRLIRTGQRPLSTQVQRPIYRARCFRLIRFHKRSGAESPTQELGIRNFHINRPQYLGVSSPRAAMATSPTDVGLTKSATFLVLTVGDDASAAQQVRSTLSSLDDLAKNVASRDPSAHLGCTVGIGADAWDKITGARRPAELRPFKAISGTKHQAPSTPGDLLFHIRADRRDLCFEFERQLMDNLGSAVTLVDTTVGFRYFDLRDLLGFVDGTANPIGPAIPQTITVAEQDDQAAAGGTYVVVQKYLHDMGKWRAASTTDQESIVGRTKLDNIELDDAPPGKQKSHKELATIVDADGNEHDIFRDNMPFGSPASGEYGTYFIGYSRNLWVIEKMLERMFVGEPPGLHDRILDFSRAVTGTVFFAPANSLLQSLES
ncbi:hypothetical protein PFICI_03719 [Pestalotiopsis fici W106-1]|uniref:Dyp-type peroxidase n=1 Tax=Pestalotiopsis fici (strain W106-1 / CGMCC3.15140) TaxID=1229662 RepID=W3XI65_PESFW|nr:uncharacterized protein PFICI_03719 [Pestalotiopsis fici W106-1]ETS85694.1 hypothetical protein PFICI_03719 [Pestalotiopsis fici W106-1]